MRKVISFGKNLLVKKYHNNEGRRIMQLYDVELNRDLIRGYVDDDLLLSVHVTNTLLTYIENGYKVKVDDQWKE